MIGERLQQLSKQRSPSSYSRQKNSLEKELESFLSSLSSLSHWLLLFGCYSFSGINIWKERNSKTLVHLLIVYGPCTPRVYSPPVAVPGALHLEQWMP